MRELKVVMARDNLRGAVGIRGSALTGKSDKKDGVNYAFDNGPKKSDVDLYIESKRFSTLPQNDFGMVKVSVVHTRKGIETWSKKWSRVLGRPVAIAGFDRGKVPSDKSSWTIME